MGFNFTKLCSDYGIPIANSSHRHYRNGWVNVPCPYCSGNAGYHLGYKQNGFGFVCYRCAHKFHNMIETVAILTNSNWGEASELVKYYGGDTNSVITIKKKAYDLENEIELPIGTRKLDQFGISYLEKRGYDIDELVDVWNVKQTGPMGRMKYRIVIPIYFREQRISWTCRDYTGASPLRYISCSQALEKVPHKEMLYGIDLAIRKDKVIVVEGCFDVWKMGRGCVGTFGTAITSHQIKLLANFKKVIFYADNDRAGILSNRKVCEKLHVLGVKSRIEVCSKEDAGALDLSESRYIADTL